MTIFGTRALRIRLLKLCAAMAVIWAIPVSDSVTYSVYEFKHCRYCYEQRWDKRDIFGNTDYMEYVEVPIYWFKNVDPHHKHTWQHEWTRKISVRDAIERACQRRLGLPYIVVDYFRPSVLEPRAIIAVLESFKTPAERKAFAEKYLLMYIEESASRQDNQPKDYQLQVKLQDYYDQNPSRKDWQKILKRLKVI